ncbi:hypothetical protein ACIA5D_42780 [Actinoplanes sp. NPDC051513]|uniref:hypothetical protein n=1 Tax=Actinoplanes sp. NPDC051513 TaxID=3363908 RepID=UPI0037A483E2
MERQSSAAISRSAYAAVIIGYCLVGAFFVVAALLVLSGAVTVAGWGEGTLAQRVVVGLLAFLVGGAALAAARIRLTQGRSGARPAEDAPAVRSDQHWDGSGTHPGVGEF